MTKVSRNALVGPVEMIMVPAGQVYDWPFLRTRCRRRDEAVDRPPASANVNNILAVLQVVLLEFLVERRTCDAQRFRRMGLVALAILKRLLNRVSLNRIQRAPSERKSV